jgi:hypothetical protein
VLCKVSEGIAGDGVSDLAGAIRRGEISQIALCRLASESPGLQLTGYLQARSEMSLRAIVQVMFR